MVERVKIECAALPTCHLTKACTRRPFSMSFMKLVWARVMPGVRLLTCNISLELWCKIKPRRAKVMDAVLVRKTTLHNSDNNGDLKDKSPQQLIGMMWQLALNAWAFKENLNAEPRLQRHVVVLKGRGR